MADEQSQIPSAVQQLLRGAAQPLTEPLERGVRSAVSQFLDQRVRPEIERTGERVRTSITALALVIGAAVLLRRSSKKEPTS